MIETFFVATRNSPALHDIIQIRAVVIPANIKHPERVKMWEVD